MAGPPLRAFLAASPGDRLQYFRAVLTLPLAQLALRSVGYPRLVRRLGGSPRKPAGEITGLLRSRHRAVERAGRYLPWKTTCLDRSFTLWWLLRRDGVPATLRIGVRRGETAVEAHAWVEHDGHAINDSPDVAERYAPFDAPLR